jgi:hypothetical protein
VLRFSGSRSSLIASCGCYLHERSWFEMWTSPSVAMIVEHSILLSVRIRSWSILDGSRRGIAEVTAGDHDAMGRDRLGRIWRGASSKLRANPSHAFSPPIRQRSPLSDKPCEDHTTAMKREQSCRSYLWSLFCWHQHAGEPHFSMREHEDEQGTQALRAVARDLRPSHWVLGFVYADSMQPAVYRCLS